MEADNPTARALRTLELLQAAPGITADRLAARLGVSERAARRYVGTLRAAGIPVESARGPYGGYRLGRGVRLPPLVFDATEALGLVMAVLDGHHHAGDPEDPVGNALGKIMRALPAPVAAQAEAVRRTAAAVPDRSAARPDPATTTVLVEACAGHRRVRIGYTSESGRSWSAEVEPWAVVVRHGRWYLLCQSLCQSLGRSLGRSPRAGATRTYRIDRVAEVALLDETFVPPAGLDPVAALEEHLGSGWEHPTEVLIAAPLDLVARCLPRTLGRLEEVDDRTTRLVGSTSNPFGYLEGLVLAPAAYRIVEGPELRAAARSLGERLVAAAATDEGG